MSCCLGWRTSGKRRLTAARICAASSTDSVVCVTTARRSACATSRRCDVVDVLDQVDAAFELAHRALDLGMALVADHDEVVAFLVQLGDLDVDLGDERTGRVEDAEAARRGLLAHRLRDAVRAEDQRGARRHVVEVLDEDRALGLQVVDDVGVVDDLVAHVDRRAELGQRALDDLDRAIHAGAKAARLRQHDFLETHVGTVLHSTPISWTSKRTGRPASGWLKSISSDSSPTSRTTPA